MQVGHGVCNIIGLNGVKIQLNLNQISEHDQDEEEEQTEDFEVLNSKPKRKYTLEELEVEGFESTTSSTSKNSEFEEEDLEGDLEEEEEEIEVDLNSLIEGDVDEIDELGKNFRLKFLVLCLLAQNYSH